MTQKIYDLAVKTGEYQKGNETKARYETIGSVMQKDDGGKFLLLKRSFNPAGVPFKEGGDSIIVSMFEPKDEQSQRQQPQQQRQQPSNSATRQQQSGRPSFVPDDDDTPF